MTWPGKIPLIAILRGITPVEAPLHISALLDAGFDSVEIPLNSPDYAQSISAAVERFGDRALLGGGTVLLPKQVDWLADIQARLVVTPNTQPAVIRRAVERGMTICAGVATISEAFIALDAGAQALKLFPASTFGPSYVKALKAVLPASVPLFAVGGITPENLADYIQVGCAGAGLGNDLYRAGQEVEVTVRKAQRFIAAWRQVSAFTTP